MNLRTPAPELPAGLDWVNVSEAPTLAAQRGRVTLLWFWTYDSVNCWDLIPDLRYLENRYHDGLTVIGLHCPKYPQQIASGSLLKAVNRHQLRHAVANDSGYLSWQQYGVPGWPTVALVDAEGNLAAVLPGEGRRTEIEKLIAQLLDEAAGHDLRVYEPALPASRPEPRAPLRFPGKIAATDGALYVADSGNHRILECSHDGRVLRQFGSGNPGHWDGKNADAGFNDPQGIVATKEVLYVADRGNHCVRRIRLLGGEVDTILGSGELGRSRTDDSDSRQVSLCAPTDLALVGDKLFVTLAGQHQVWELDLTTLRTRVFAGNGRLGLIDGEARDASFAQPSGIAVVGQQLVVADAAASAIRAVRVADARVSTVIGTGLYEFGDAAGQREKARLQNPLGVAADARGLVFVADSYNGKLKALNLKTGELRALNLPYRFHEPGGLSVAAGALWVANSNAHEIVRIDLSSGATKRIPVGE